MLFVASLELLVGDNDLAVGEDNVGVEHFDVQGDAVRLSLGCDCRCREWAFGVAVNAGVVDLNSVD